MLVISVQGHRELMPTPSFYRQVGGVPWTRHQFLVAPATQRHMVQIEFYCRRFVCLFHSLVPGTMIQKFIWQNYTMNQVKISFETERGTSKDPDILGYSYTACGNCQTWLCLLHDSLSEKGKKKRRELIHFHINQLAFLQRQQVHRSSIGVWAGKLL